MNSENTYDTIVVGSGNGACGFLSRYLEKCHPMSKILVLESGKDFFETSDITHQNNWTKSYAEGNIFQLHNAQTIDNIPIISGCANTMGGGGSINYAMIHESSSWLSSQFGHTEEYWDDLKQELNDRLDCLDPTERQTQLTKFILQSSEEEGFSPPDSNHHIRNIPSYCDLTDGNSKQLYLFSTQFNSFGQRTHSGVSLIDGLYKHIDLRTQCQVTRLKFDATQTGEFYCQAVQVRCLDTGETKYFFLNENGRIVLCDGAATPRLLMPHRQDLNNDEIGKNASDHIAIPLGIYQLKKKDILEQELRVTPRDNYAPIFATTVWKPEKDDNSSEPTVCTFEFFSGNFERLWFFISHIYLAFLLPNWIKKIMIRQPRLFKCFKMIRLVVEKLNAIFNLGEGIDLITAIVKFNPATEGEYSNKDNHNRITLGFFETDKTSFNQDKIVAETVIRQHLSLMNRLGDKPHWSIRAILKYLGIPFDESQVKKYLDRYSKKYLLSQQHMAGGCLFGKAICKGLDNPQHTGKVKGSANVYVADLSASPLPRVSPQMTAYLIGFHVATQLNKLPRADGDERL